eukprot:m51a1_g1657 hypothetical protein (355) ;mRNA; r:365699-367978
MTNLQELHAVLEDLKRPGRLERRLGLQKLRRAVSNALFQRERLLGQLEHELTVSALQLAAKANLLTEILDIAHRLHITQHLGQALVLAKTLVRLGEEMQRGLDETYEWVACGQRLKRAMAVVREASVMPKVDEYLVVLRAAPTSLVVASYTREQLAELRAAAGARSTNDAVVALVWKLVVDARALPDGERTRIGLACDARRRLCSPLPDNWWGCANVFALVPAATAAEVRGSSLAQLAARVRAAVDAQAAGCAAATVRAAVAGLAEGKALDPTWGDSPGDFAVTSTVRSGLHDEGVADFGTGAPVFHAPPRIAGVGVVMVQAAPNGGARVYFHSSCSEAAYLRSDAARSRLHSW